MRTTGSVFCFDSPQGTEGKMSLRRREFIAGIGGAATWPLAARAQPGLPVIGFLGGESLDLYAGRLRAFHQGLRETGFVEGRNVAFEYRWAEGEYGRFPTPLADLVSRKVAVIAVPGGHTLSARGQGGDRDHPDRLRDRRRPGCGRTCHQPEPAGR